MPGGVAFFTSSFDKANAALRDVILCDDEARQGSQYGDDFHKLERWALHGVAVPPRLYMNLRPDGPGVNIHARLHSSESAFVSV